MGKFNLAESAFGASVSKLDTDKIRHIALDKLADNAANFYGIREIEKLADSIREVGLLDPVVAVPVGDGYRLISGHRRLAAYRLLAEEDREKYGTIPTRVVAAMDDLRETLALVTANSTVRELTYAEKLQQEKVLRETLTAMKEAGMEVPRNLGTYMAEQLGTSRNEVSRMHSVNENLIPEAREKVDAGELNARQAYDLSRQPEKEQRDAIASPMKVARGDLSEVRPPMQAAMDAARRQIDVMRGVEHLLADMLPRVASLGGISSRSDGISELKAGLKRRGSFGDRQVYLTACENTLGITLQGTANMIPVTPSELWDALSIAAMRKVRSIQVPGQTEIQPDMWHTGDPTEKGSYICLYRPPSGAVGCGMLDWDWREGCWKRFGQPVGDVYEVVRWTEVPK